MYSSSTRIRPVGKTRRFQRLLNNTGLRKHLYVGVYSQPPEGQKTNSGKIMVQKQRGAAPGEITRLAPQVMSSTFANGGSHQERRFIRNQTLVDLAPYGVSAPVCWFRSAIKTPEKRRGRCLVKAMRLCAEQRGSYGAILTIGLLIALFPFGASTLSAQGAAGALHGTVQSATGAPIAGASVLARNLETRRSRTATTNPRGRFLLPQLLPGAYELEVSYSGFITQVEKLLQLDAGERMARNFVLQDDANGETESRVGADPHQTARTARTASRISQDQLSGLPLNGRSYTQLATLQAGITDTTAASGSRGIGGGRLTVAGGRSFTNSFLLDGTNIMNTENTPPRSAAGVQLGSDAILQVRVFSGNAGPEYGRGSGGVFNAITRSGTSELHGTIFEYLRNSKLDARNFFDPGTPPPFKRNQFGFTLTGPIAKDRTFFMGSYEGLRDRLTTTDLSYFPDEEARQGKIVDNNGQVKVIPVDPRVKPYLDLYPLPNDIRLSRGIARNFAPEFLPTDETFFTVRLDHKLSERDSLFGRYSFDDATNLGSGAFFLFKTIQNTRQQYLTLVESHIFSLNVVNAIRLGYTQPVAITDNLTLVDIPTDLYFVPDLSQFGQIQIPGLASFGPTPNLPRFYVMNTFQFADDLIVQRGDHALKFGFQVHRYRWDLSSRWNVGGVWAFNSLEDFLNEKTKPGTSLTVAFPGSDNFHDFRQTFAGFYAQDEYRVSAALQLNLGLRYEFITNLRDRKGKAVALPDPFHDTELQVTPTWFKDNPSLLSFSPRLGFTWAPWSRRNFVLRGGFGIYYDPILGYVGNQRKSTAPFYNMAVNPNFDAAKTGPFPDAITAAQGIPFQVQILDYLHTKTPTVFRYNVSIQQNLGGGWHLQAGYVGARGNHLLRRYEANLYPVPEVSADGSVFFPPGSGPINPAFGAISVIGTDAQSFYNSLQLTAGKTFSRGFSWQASYNYSKSVDDNSTGPNGNFGQYPLMRTLDRGLSDFDIRRRLVVNYFYNLPLGSGQRWWKSGPLPWLFGGWRVGGITTLRSGVPFSAGMRVRYPNYLFQAKRPNLAPGASNNPTSGTSTGCGRIPAGTELGRPELYYDPCAFELPPPGTLGNLGRNTLIAPSVFNMDVSLQRDFILGAKRRLQFRADFFNLLNHTNFNRNTGGSAVVFTGESGSRNAPAGRLGGTATTSRQIQFAMRFSF